MTYPSYEIAIACLTVFILILYILKKRRLQTELHKIQTELGIALDAGYVAVWRYNVKKDAFRALHRITIPDHGMTLAELKGRVHPKEWQKYDDFFNALLTGREERKNGIFHLNINEKDEWCEVYTIALKDQNGKVNQIIGTEHNISVEMRLKQKNEKNAQMLDFIFDAINIMPWEYDVQERTFTVSDAFVQRYEYPGNSIAIADLMQYLHPSDRHLLADGIDNMIRKNRPMIIQIRSKAPNRDTYKWFEMQGVVYRRNEEGQAVSLIGLKHDITELKHTEEQARLREKAEESNRLKSAFLANMSHDIRTPLNAIVGFSTLMAETDDKEERQEFAQIIQTNNDMLLHLINDILDMSKIEAGQMDFIYSNVDLKDLIQNLAYTFRFKIKEGVELCLEMPPEPLILYTEKNRLTQVLSNFISNACKYTTKGTIAVGFEFNDKQVYFYVTDTGKGIEEKNLSHVFERFAKFDTFVKGTGLGLSICELIVQTLGGEIGVESEVGKGSTFWFTLPISERVES
ncbi:PAS domain-containing sensor histidine kinase [uncultured Parabacteroides sp.]|uniref:sensor histidine kinase n=1 Tax=uncultured Parabacteroides sp. TaxID=512312 RepID=UPI0025DCCBB0|nr:PAS domain-containing sensor histidine kinase [uncultured Parabacteroides sp.]